MEFYKNVDSQKPHMVFIGRWCPLHKGHTWIIEQKMLENPGKPVLILVRDTNFDEQPAAIRAIIVSEWMKHNKIKGTVMLIPDIEGVYYGRGVGYNVDEIKPPEGIVGISATQIRQMIKDDNKEWEKIVAPGTVEIIKKFIGGQ